MITLLRKAFWTGGLLLLICGGITGCDKVGEAVGPGKTMTVLAGSELKDLEPLLPQIESATGLRLKFTYVGSLDAVEQLQQGASYDLVWLANNKYAMLTPAVKSRIKASERVMISPVVLGVKQSKAHELGWDDVSRPPTWAEIARAGGNGRFRFGMTNPASSNTGFSAWLGLASAIAGKGEAMELADIDFKTLAQFAHAQAVTSGSSGWLGELYQREEDSLDGMVNYASVLNSMNASGKLKEKLFLVYPKDGVLTADYPVMLLDETRRSDYDKLVAYLKDKPFQTAMTAQTKRAPATPGVIPAVPMPTYFEMAFPSRLAVVNGLLDAYLNTARRPADSTFVVDVSGSMDGNRLTQLKRTLVGLTGQDQSLSGRFARLRNRERISLLVFSSGVDDQRKWALGTESADNVPILQDFSALVENLRAHGSTALYSAAQTAYEQALGRQQQDPGREYSILLMTDGQSNTGLTAREFSAWFRLLPPQQHRIRIYAILFGEASKAELEEIAEPTGGRVFDANQDGLQAAFKEIRGYQ